MSNESSSQILQDLLLAQRLAEEEQLTESERVARALDMELRGEMHANQIIRSENADEARYFQRVDEIRMAQQERKEEEKESNVYKQEENVNKAIKKVLKRYRNSQGWEKDFNPVFIQFLTCFYATRNDDINREEKEPIDCDVDPISFESIKCPTVMKYQDNGSEKIYCFLSAFNHIASLAEAMQLNDSLPIKEPCTTEKIDISDILPAMPKHVTEEARRLNLLRYWGMLNQMEEYRALVTHVNEEHVKLIICSKLLEELQGFAINGEWDKIKDELAEKNDYLLNSEGELMKRKGVSFDEEISLRKDTSFIIRVLKYCGFLQNKQVETARLLNAFSDKLVEILSDPKNVPQHQTPIPMS